MSWCIKAKPSMYVRVCFVNVPKIGQIRAFLPLTPSPGIMGSKTCAPPYLWVKQYETLLEEEKWAENRGLLWVDCWSEFDVSSCPCSCMYAQQTYPSVAPIMIRQNPIPSKPSHQTMTNCMFYTTPKILNIQMILLFEISID